MIYRFGITTPANTPEAQRQKTTLHLAKGIIHRIDVKFPPGPQGLLHCQIQRGAYQLWPQNTGASFASDDDNIEFNEYYELAHEPLELQAYTWNDDDTYSHIIIIRIGILPKKWIFRRLL